MGGGDPIFVVAIDPQEHVVFVGGRDLLVKRNVHLKEMNWLLPEQPKQWVDVSVKIRSSQQPVDAKVRFLDNNSAEVQLLEPETALANGQACVIYRHRQVLGGGWISGSS